MNKLRTDSEKPTVICAPDGIVANAYDPELLYVECKMCGRPILWEPGRTTSLLLQSNINPLSVDAHCLILSDGCRDCMPESEGYHLSIVRLAQISASALLLLQKPVGTA